MFHREYSAAEVGGHNVERHTLRKTTMFHRFRFKIALANRRRTIINIKQIFSNTEFHLSATKDCNITLFATSQLTYNMFSTNIMLLPAKLCVFQLLKVSECFNYSKSQCVSTTQSLRVFQLLKVTECRLAQRGWEGGEAVVSYGKRNKLDHMTKCDI